MVFLYFLCFCSVYGLKMLTQNFYFVFLFFFWYLGSSVEEQTVLETEITVQFWMRFVQGVIAPSPKDSWDGISDPYDSESRKSIFLESYFRNKKAFLQLRFHFIVCKNVRGSTTFSRCVWQCLHTAYLWKQWGFPPASPHLQQTWGETVQVVTTKLTSWWGKKSSPSQTVFTFASC